MKLSNILIKTLGFKLGFETTEGSSKKQTKRLSNAPRSKQAFLQAQIGFYTEGSIGKGIYQVKKVLPASQCLFKNATNFV